MVIRAKSGTLKPKALTLSAPITEPNTVSEALLVPEWKEAMQAEFDVLIQNGTWSLVPYSPDMNIISTKWIFRFKYHKDGTVERYKARLVARGFQQNASIDNFHTYSLVVKPVTLRINFSLVVTYGRDIQQVDINNAFLKGDLQETVYNLST